MASHITPSQKQFVDRFLFEDPQGEKPTRLREMYRLDPLVATGSEMDKLLSLIRSAEISVSGVMNEINLTVDDLLKISAGDVIQLNKPMSEPVLLCVAGIPKFLGHVVMRRGKRAFEITDRYAL